MPISFVLCGGHPAGAAADPADGGFLNGEHCEGYGRASQWRRRKVVPAS